MDSVYKLLALFLISLIVVSAAMSGAAIGSQSSETSRITDENIQEEIGDVVQIPIQVSPYDTATLTVSDQQYSTTATVTDRNGDGQIKIRINTFQAQREGGSSGYEVASPDHLREVSEGGAKQLSPGEYTLSIDGKESTSKLFLNTAKFYQGQLHTAPGGISINKTTVTEHRSPVPSQIAQGDMLIAEFEAEGIMGSGRFDNPPGDDGVVPVNSTTRAETSHIVQVSGKKNETEFREVRVDYTSTKSSAPSKLIKINISNAGIDSDQDGQIDKPIKSSISNVNTNSEGIISIAFDNSYNISDTDTLILKYGNITNPPRAGTNPVEVGFGSEKIDTTVEYGPSSSGNFGNGLDVNVNTTSSNQFVTPMPFQYITVPSNDRLYIIMQTGELEDMSGESITVTLSQTALTENSSRKESSTEAQIVTPTANIQVDNNQWDSTSEPLHITGTTSLAPNSELWIQIRSVSSSPSPWIYHYSTKVYSNRTVNARITEHRINTSETVYVQPVTRDGPIGPKRTVKITKGAS